MTTIDFPKRILPHLINVATRSPCQKSKRGTAIFVRDTGELLSLGYNRPPAGHDCDGYCYPECNRGSVHAEQSALRNLPSNILVRPGDIAFAHLKVKNGQMCVSGLPSCPACSTSLLDARLGGGFLYHESGWQYYDIETFHKLSLENDRFRK